MKCPQLHNQWRREVGEVTLAVSLAWRAGNRRLYLWGWGFWKKCFGDE